MHALDWAQITRSIEGEKKHSLDFVGGTLYRTNSVMVPKCLYESTHVRRQSSHRVRAQARRTDGERDGEEGGGREGDARWKGKAKTEKAKLISGTDRNRE